MNNPLRALIQRRFEAARLLRMGGPMEGGSALEIGCGRGVGVQLILDLFGADAVDAFDLDPRMVALGVPTIDGMGPIGGNAHRTDEYVDLDSVVPQIHLIASVCLALVGVE